MMENKPTIHELEKLLTDDTKQVTLEPDGAVKIEDADSHDVIVRKLNQRIQSLECQRDRMEDQIEMLKNWIQLCPITK